MKYHLYFPSPSFFVKKGVWHKRRQSSFLEKSGNPLKGSASSNFSSLCKFTRWRKATSGSTASRKLLGAWPDWGCPDHQDDSPWFWIYCSCLQTHTAMPLNKRFNWARVTRTHASSPTATDQDHDILLMFVHRPAQQKVKSDVLTGLTAI